jgi:hypothetical protein
VALTSEAETEIQLHCGVVRDVVRNIRLANRKHHAAEEENPNCMLRGLRGELKEKTTTPNQSWQTDLTYLKVIARPLHHPRWMRALHHGRVSVLDNACR